MSYSPIRLTQLDVASLTDFTIKSINGVAVLNSGDQNVNGFKSFGNGISTVNPTGLENFNTNTQTINGDWNYYGPITGFDNLITLGFLQNGQYNLPDVVRTTGMQNVSGEKTFGNNIRFFNQVRFGANSNAFTPDDVIIGQHSPNLLLPPFPETLIFDAQKRGFISPHERIMGDFYEGFPMATFSWGANNRALMGDWSAGNLSIVSKLSYLAVSSERTFVDEINYFVPYECSYLAVNSSGSEKRLFFSEHLGANFAIKDCAGLAGTNNIILSGASGYNITFDKQLSYRINSNFGSVKLIFDGISNFEIN